MKKPACYAAYDAAAAAVLSALRATLSDYGAARKDSRYSEADAIRLDFLDRLDAANKILSCDPEAEGVDEWFAYRGPCSCCGHPDARHRMFDAIISRCRAGEATLDVADDYGVPLCAVVAVLQDQPYHEPHDDTLVRRVMMGEPEKRSA
jgi:hypothetical protein